MGQIKWAGALLGLLLGTSALAAVPKVQGKADKMLQDSQRLVETGKFAEAYTLMQPFEFEKSGDVTFDYLFGISAVNAGKPDRATLALERVEAIYPEFGDVRMWLGMAYFQTGDSARSKAAFTTLLTQKSLSEQSKATAVQYLDAIKQQEDAKQLEIDKAKQAYVIGALELGMGRDSNITTVASNSGGSSGTPASSGLAGNFAQLNANVEFRKPMFDAGTFAFILLDSGNRAYPSHNNMNAYTNTLKSGINWQSGAHTYRFDVSRRDYRQQGITAGTNSNSAQNTLSGDARLGLGQYDFLGFSLQYSTPRYAKTPTQDTNQIVLGSNYMHIFPATGSPLIYVALSHTRDRATQASVPLSTLVATTDVSRNTNTLVLYSQYTFVPSADVTGMWMTSRRADTQPYARSAAEIYGKDDMRVVMLGMNWRPATNWIVKPQFMKLENKSAIAGYAFMKNEVSVSVKREFK